MKSFQSRPTHVCPHGGFLELDLGFWAFIVPFSPYVSLVFRSALKFLCLPITLSTWPSVR